MVRQRESLRGCTRRNVSPLLMRCCCRRCCNAAQQESPCGDMVYGEAYGPIYGQAYARFMRVVMGGYTAQLQVWRGQVPRPTRPCGPSLA